MTDKRSVLKKLSKNTEEVRDRLHRAALKLYQQQGYDRTTTAEIAASAGVTERTFFRYFPDKREVLFVGEAELRTILVGAADQAPPELSPMAVVLHALKALQELLEKNRAAAAERYIVIAATPALQERALAKTESVTADLTSALQRRGLDENLSRLASRTGMAIFSYAVRAWGEDPSRGIDAHLDAAFLALQSLASDR